MQPDIRSGAGKEILDEQRPHWENTFAKKPDMFGQQPSEPARKALEVFKREGFTKILELGGGQGRDTIFFAQNGLHVSVLDYAESGVKVIAQKADALGLSRSINPIRHDIRDPLPFDDASFDACYSHMLYCMALGTPELEGLSQEVWRVLKPRRPQPIYGQAQR